MVPPTPTPPRSFAHTARSHGRCDRRLGWKPVTWDSGDDQTPFFRSWEAMSKEDQRCAHDILGFPKEDFGPPDDGAVTDGEIAFDKQWLDMTRLEQGAAPPTICANVLPFAVDSFAAFGCAWGQTRRRC